QRNAAAVALVRHGCVVEAIADDDFAACERWQNLFCDVLASRREEKQQLCGCGQMNRFRVQKDLPYAFADGGSTRLARDRVWDGTFCEIVRKDRDLSRLAAAFDTFKAEKPAVLHFAIQCHARPGIVAEPPRFAWHRPSRRRPEDALRSSQPVPDGLWFPDAWARTGNSSPDPAGSISRKCRFGGQ